MGNLGDYIDLSETFIGLLSGGLLLYLLLGGVAVVTLDYIGAKGRNEELMVDRSGASEKTAGAR